MIDSLTDDERRKIALMALALRDHTAEELEKIDAAALDARLTWGIWENVLNGDVHPDIDADGELGFVISEKGKREVEDRILPLIEAARREGRF